jgi:hypothetical protein
MNYSQSFEEFSKGLTNTDLMVYGGAALILFVLFKDQLTPLKTWAVNLYTNIVNKVKADSIVTIPTAPVVDIAKPNDNDFLKLIASWKNTRNLAEVMGCVEAVKILDTAFPHLGPHECVKEGSVK